MKIPALTLRSERFTVRREVSPFAKVGGGGTVGHLIGAVGGPYLAQQI